MNIINIEHISKIFGGKVIFDDVSCGISEGEKIGVIGINGTGKSTLLKILAKIEEPDSGKVICANHVVMRYLPQNPFFLPEKTVLESVLEAAAGKQDTIYAGANAGGKHEINEKIWEMESSAKAFLTRLGITNFTQKTKELSGGQKKRVAIAGVLAMNPKILILDEPTAGLDPKGRDDILDQIAELHKVRGITIILVSHSMEDIAKYAERLIVVNDGEIAYDDAPKAVFAHYRELEAMGLAAPQITYIMHALKEKGLDVDVTATTVDEAKENILAVLRKCNPGKLSGDRQSVSDSQSKKENAKAETLISEMEADLTEDGTKESHSDVPDEDLSIQKETMDKKSAEQEENEGGQEV